MTGLDTDLATLRLIQREMADHPAFPVSSESMLAALDRVEAEIVRLRERTVRLETQQLSEALDLRDTEMEEAKAEIERLNRVADNLVIAADVEKEKREAAERELARLTENLRLSREAHWATVAEKARLQEGLRRISTGPTRYAQREARALLAENGAAGYPGDGPGLSPEEAAAENERLNREAEDGAADSPTGEAFHDHYYGPKS